MSIIPLVIICVLLAFIFTGLLLRSWSRARKGKILRAGLYTFPAILTLMAFFLMLLVISNLTTYQRLTHEREILRLSIQKESHQMYQVTLEYLNLSDEGRTESYRIQGDEWQLDAKILKWEGWANLIGLDSYFQLDRIRGRYRNVEEAANNPSSVYDLAGELRGIDLWELKQLMKTSLPMIDAYYGQAVFLPLEAGAIYTISVNQSGLLARPDNEIGQQSVEKW